MSELDDQHRADFTKPAPGAAAQDVVGEVRGAARDVLHETRAAGATLKSEAGGLTQTLKDGLVAQAEERKNAIADRIGRIAERVQSSAGDLRDDEAWLAGWMDRGAQELGSLADEIRRNDVPGLVGSAEVFARRQPAVFVGAAVALGFAITRVLRGGDSGVQPPSYQSSGLRPYRPSTAQPGRHPADTPAAAAGVTTAATPAAAMGESRSYAAGGGSRSDF